MNKYFNATRLIPLDYKGRRIKKVRHFIDNKYIHIDEADIITKKGKGGYTSLPMKFLPEYLLWLTPGTRKAFLKGIPTDDIINNIEDYWD